MTLSRRADFVVEMPIDDVLIEHKQKDRYVNESLFR